MNERTEPAAAPRIAVLDYGIGNLRSAEKAFAHVGADAFLTADRSRVDEADAVVLPGVGAFGPCRRALAETGLDEVALDAVASGRPFLGICVGMQLMFTEGHEMGVHQGLDLLPGKVVKFPDSLTVKNSQSTINHLKVPHMGWNQLEPAWENPLLDDIQAGDYTYFVHSYYCDPEDATAVLAWTDYGFPFASVVAKDNIYGLQFHPEKSQNVGLTILKNFVEKL